MILPLDPLSDSRCLRSSPRGYGFPEGHRPCSVSRVTRRDRVRRNRCMRTVRSAPSTRSCAARMSTTGVARSCFRARSASAPQTGKQCGQANSDHANAAFSAGGSVMMLPAQAAMLSGGLKNALMQTPTRQRRHCSKPSGEDHRRRCRHWFSSTPRYLTALTASKAGSARATVCLSPVVHAVGSFLSSPASHRAARQARATDRMATLCNRYSLTFSATTARSVLERGAPQHGPDVYDIRRSGAVSGRVAWLTTGLISG